MFGQVEIDVLRSLEQIRTPFLNVLAQGITMLGEAPVFIVIAAALYFVIDKKFAQKFLYLMCAGLCVTNVVKNFVCISRPFVADPTLNPIRKETATGYSFPSGHTATASAWMTAIAQKLKKPWAWIVACVLVLAVGFSRMYLGVHYPSDVAVGLLIGILGMFLFGWLFDKWENKLPAFAILVGVNLVFAVIFLFRPDPEFRDFYKMFGFGAGYMAAYFFEKKFVGFTNDIPLWKRLIRCAVGFGLAVGLLLGLDPLVKMTSGNLPVFLILHAVHYFVMALIVLGLYPWLFKKLKF